MRHSTSPPTPSCATHSPRSPPGALPSRWRPTPATPVPPPVRDQGRSPQGTGLLTRGYGHTPAPPRRRDPRGSKAGPRGHPHPLLRGSIRARRPPLGARGARRGTRLSANAGGHRRHGGPPCAAPPGNSLRPLRAHSPELQPRLGAVGQRGRRWLPRALRAALRHWRYCPRSPPPLQPQPPQKRRRR